MPVWKYRSVQEMPPPPAYAPGSEQHLRQWTALWARATRLAAPRFRRGVTRYRGIDDPQRGE